MTAITSTQLRAAGVNVRKICQQHNCNVDNMLGSSLPPRECGIGALHRVDVRVQAMPGLCEHCTSMLLAASAHSRSAILIRHHVA